MTQWKRKQTLRRSGKRTREIKTQEPHGEEWNKDGDIGGAETGNSFRDTKEKKQCLCD